MLTLRHQNKKLISSSRVIYGSCDYHIFSPAAKMVFGGLNQEERINRLLNTTSLQISETTITTTTTSMIVQALVSQVNENYSDESVADWVDTCLEKKIIDTEPIVSMMVVTTLLESVINVGQLLSKLRKNLAACGITLPSQLTKDLTMTSQRLDMLATRQIHRFNNKNKCETVAAAPTDYFKKEVSPSDKHH